MTSEWLFAQLKNMSQQHKCTINLIEKGIILPLQNWQIQKSDKKKKKQ